MTFDYLFSFFSPEIRFWSDDLNEPCLSFRSFGKILWQEIVDGVKRERESGSIYKFPILRLFHVFSLHQSHLDTIAAAHCASICLNICGAQFSRNSSNISQFDQIYIGDPLRVEANLGTDGK